jgi:hypothetical protein
LVSHTKGEVYIEGVCESVLRRIFRPKREEVVGGWRRLHNEGLRNLYTSPNIVRITKRRLMRFGACSTHGRDEKWTQ